MRKLFAALGALALSMTVLVSPAQAYSCDPGRADNGDDSSIEVKFVPFFGHYFDRLDAVIEEDSPFLESGDAVNQYIEMYNGTNFMRMGLNYANSGVTIFITGSGGVGITHHTYALSLSQISPSIRTYSIGTTRYWDFYNGSTFLRQIALGSGKWTPNNVTEVVQTTTDGNQIVGNVGNVAYIRDDVAHDSTNGVWYNVTGAIHNTNGFPGVYGDDGDLWTRDNC